MYESDDFSDLFDEMIGYPLQSIDKFKKNGSGWVFDHVEYFDISIDPFEPLSGSSYIPTPKILANRKAIINPKNENDNECFKYAITLGVFPIEKNPQRVNKEMIENSKKFNWSGIKFPVEWKDIDKFEKQNPKYMICVHGFNKGSGEIYPLRTSKKESGYLIDLLLISNDEGNKHYCWIKDFNKLVSSQVDKNHHKLKICRRCYKSYQKEESLEKHKEYCNENEEANIVMPKDKDGNPLYIQFKKFNKKMRVPFLFYVDFETTPEKIHTCSPDESKSFTKQYQKHKPSGFCYYIKCFDESILPSDFEKIKRYTAKSSDENVEQIFVDCLVEDAKKIYNKIIKPRNYKFYYYNKKNMSEMDKKDYKNATHCHICEGELGEDKVLDHCHLTGKYRGAAHTECNLNYKIPEFFPVYIHNLSGFDSHLFIKNLATSEDKIKCIPNNEEKYISFSKKIKVDEFINEEGKLKPINRDIRFVDSFKFMSTSLEKIS